jgi:Tol biopolymer transport system component
VEPVVRFNVFPPEGNKFGNHPGPAISPDGRRVAFVTVGDHGYRMWIRALDQAEAQAIPGADGGALPFWSPDGHTVAFFAADHKLKRIELDGPSGVSPPLTLCDVADNAGGTWGRAGVIVFADRTGRLFRVPAGGGAAVMIDQKKSDPTEYDTFPSFLPDGRHFLYEAVIQKKRTIHVGSIDSPDTSFVMESDSNAVFSRGTILYTHNSLLLAQPFDARRFALTGNPVSVAEPVAVITGYGNFSAAPETGTVVYAQGSAAPFALSWFNRSGKRLGALGEPINPAYPNSYPNFSPDGRKLAIDHTDLNNGDVWIYDTVRGVRERFTFDASLDISPVWSPDGKQIVFSSARKGPLDLYRKPSDGAMPEQLLYADGRNKVVTSWSRDGKFLLFQQCCDTPHPSIWVLPLPIGANGPASEPYPLLESPVDETHAEFSPDGKWIVYEANVPEHSGIYLARFEGRPSSAAVVRQISSTEDAHFPRWRKDGREIFYFTRQRLMAVPVSVRENTVEVGKEREVLAPGETIQGFDITADGQRFILKTRSPEAGLRPMTVVQNALPALTD